MYAFRDDAPNHPAYRRWLEDALAAPDPFGFSEVVLSGFIRVVTHPRVFRIPATLDQAFAFTEALRSQPNAVPLAPSERHWSVFEQLCRKADARGNLVPDGYLAALAVETGSELITTDRDFARFEGLRWRHPLG